ncbi:DUF397 domain-containing protein [Streptomyces sp. HU2014]|uniref:DUF397 domain-containing protein n=1 Tax=Streptomyces sp. HU2014 TaxID=2939414 RepID=UPI00201047C0|nr:DUF397 domain-containing protein [Streptomyces sp. HU2014]UQI47283.1 DUF397 domain-containing protein [Streptomyces sp. HU2014]
MNGAGWQGVPAPARPPDPVPVPASAPAPDPAPSPAPDPVPTPGDPPDRTPVWQRSSFSGSAGGSECLEAAGTPDGRFHLRESDRPVMVLTLSPGVWSAFLRAVRTRAAEPAFCARNLP